MYRDGKFKHATFEQGKKVAEKDGKSDEPNGTWVRFSPDPEIFKSYTWNDDFLARRMRYYAYLNAGLSLTYNGTVFASKGGLADLLAEELGETQSIYPTCHYRGDRLEFAFCHTGNYGETYFSFVNGQYTNDGGTHQSAFREGVLKGINEFAKKTFAGEDVRDGMLGCVAIKVKDPVFESQTKNKLGSTEVRSGSCQRSKIRWSVGCTPKTNAAEALVSKIKQNEKLRKELAAVKKEARERAKKVAIRIPKLIDCKIHFGDADKQARGEKV